MEHLSLTWRIRGNQLCEDHSRQTKCMCKGPGASKQYGTQLPKELFQMVVNKEAGTESFSSREHGKPVYLEALAIMPF